MEALFDYAASRGVQVEYCDLRHLGRAGDYHAPTKHIRIQQGMLYRKERSVLAHELAHAHYSDEPDLFGNLGPRMEARADEWAAHFLIHPDEYRLAEERYGTRTDWIAQELCVLEKLVIAYERTLHRIGDTIYVHPKLGHATTKYASA